MTWFLAMLAPFVIMTSIPNTAWTCTLDSFMLSMTYEHIRDIEENNYTMEEREWFSEMLTNGRDKFREQEYGNMYWNHMNVVLKDVKKKWLIKWFDVMWWSNYKEFKENTILEMTYFRYKEPWYFTRIGSWDWEIAPAWHAIAIIWEQWDYWVWLTDKNWWYHWYVLVEKWFWFYYTYEL